MRLINFINLSNILNHLWKNIWNWKGSSVMIYLSIVEWDGNRIGKICCYNSHIPKYAFIVKKHEICIYICKSITTRRLVVIISRATEYLVYLWFDLILLIVQAISKYLCIIYSCYKQSTIHLPLNRHVSNKCYAEHQRCKRIPQNIPWRIRS